jgi:hypothetical protein
MSQINPELKSYAKSGFRTAAEWVSLGREVESGAKSRVDVTVRGELIGLFTRDQTHHKPGRVRQTSKASP